MVNVKVSKKVDAKRRMTTVGVPEKEHFQHFCIEVCDTGSSEDYLEERLALYKSAQAFVLCFSLTQKSSLASLQNKVRMVHVTVVYAFV